MRRAALRRAALRRAGKRLLLMQLQMAVV